MANPVILSTPVRTKHLDEMTQAEKDAFKKMLDRKFPLHPAIMARATTARMTE
jgi:hypothetical protein